MQTPGWGCLTWWWWTPASRGSGQPALSRYGWPARVTTTPAYSGGRAEQVQQLLGATGPDILYVGDHLLADVIKCRKQTEVS